MLMVIVGEGVGVNVSEDESVSREPISVRVSGRMRAGRKRMECRWRGIEERWRGENIIKA